MKKKQVPTFLLLLSLAIFADRSLGQSVDDFYGPIVAMGGLELFPTSQEVIFDDSEGNQIQLLPGKNYVARFGFNGHEEVFELELKRQDESWAKVSFNVPAHLLPQEEDPGMTFDNDRNASSGSGIEEMQLLASDSGQRYDIVISKPTRMPSYGPYTIFVRKFQMGEEGDTHHGFFFGCSALGIMGASCSPDGVEQEVLPVPTP